MAASRPLSFLLGLGIGGAFGLLSASRPGEALRADLRSRAEGRRDYLRRRGGELHSQAEEILDKGRDSVRVRKDSVTAALLAGRQAYRDAVKNSPGEGPASEQT